MSFRRLPKEIDPRRPPKRRGREGSDEEQQSEPRSYGQYIEISPEELAELERATDEVAREGSTPADAIPGGVSQRRRPDAAREEFEDTTDEVSRENTRS